MGASVSSNVQNIATNAVAKLASELANKAENHVKQSGTITIDGRQEQPCSTGGGSTPGSISVSGIVQDNELVVNMQAVLKSFNSQSSQQKLAANLQQQAKAITSGINLGQVSVASNDVSVFASAAVSLSNAISNSCTDTSNQANGIFIYPRCADVTVNVSNVTQRNMAKVLYKCIQSAVGSQSALQDIQTKVSQTAVAESKGISGWALLGMLLVGLLVMVAPELLGFGVAFYAVMKLLWPIIMVGGIVMIVLYFVLGTEQFRPNFVYEP